MISIAIKTIDRGSDKINYLGQTLKNLIEVGVFESDLLIRPVHIIDSGSPEPFQYLSTELAKNKSKLNLLKDIKLHSSSSPRTLHQTAAKAIRMASENDKADWSLVLEDDLDFCSNFLESVEKYCNDHAYLKSPMIALGANYSQIYDLYKRGKTFWLYPSNAFYGAQALVWPRHIAYQLGLWLGVDPAYTTVNKEGKVRHVKNHGHDLLLGRWLKQVLETNHLVATCPSFVQHIGKQSGINNRYFSFPWSGRNWSYV